MSSEQSVCIMKCVLFLKLTTLSVIQKMKMERQKMNSDAPATRPKTKGFYLQLKPNDDTENIETDDNEAILDTNDNFSINHKDNGSALKSDFKEINIMTNPAASEPETQTETKTFDSQVHLHMDSDYDEEEDECAIGPNRGPHIIIFSLMCCLAIFVISIIVSGYVGLLSFLNILCYYFEERTLLYRVCVCPVIMIVSPPLVAVFTLIVSVFFSIGASFLVL